MKKVLLISIFFLAFLGCKQEKKVEKIEISPQNVSVEQFGYTQLTAKVIYDDNSVDSTTSVNWQSGDTSIAIISSDGMIKGIDTGYVVISASISSITKRLEINVIQNKLFLYRWTLTSIEDLTTGKFISFPDSAPRKISINFLFGRFYTTDSIHPMFGFNGICNWGGGNCVIDSNKISFSNINDSRIYCIKYIEWEEYLLNNLRHAYEYSFIDNKLLIKSKDTYNLFFEKTTLNP